MKRETRDNTLFKRRFHVRRMRFNSLTQCIGILDLFFLLVIFFVISSLYVQISGVSVELPSAPMTGTANLEKYIITITSAENGNLIYFNDRPQTLENLAEQLSGIRDISSRRTVIIRADKAASHEVVAKVMNCVTQAGLTAFIAVTPERSRGETTFSETGK